MRPRKETPNCADVDVRVLRDADELRQGRLLQSQRYAAAGFIPAIPAGGVIDDPWVRHSTYFGASLAPSRDIVGVSRLIPCTVADSLPAFTELQLFPDQRRRIADLDPHRLSEVSALAVSSELPGGLGSQVSKALYRAMVQVAVVHWRHDYWYAALDSRVLRVLVRTQGFMFEPIGPEQDYLGSPTVPVELDLVKQIRQFALAAPSRNAYFLAGLEIDLTSPHAVLRPASGDFLLDVPVAAGQWPF